MATVIDTPEGINMFHFMQVYFGLRIQRDTGLKHSRGSLINLARDTYGTKGRTAAKVCRELEDMYFEATGTYPRGAKRG